MMRKVFLKKAMAGKQIVIDI